MLNIVEKNNPLSGDETRKGLKIRSRIFFQASGVPWITNVYKNANQEKREREIASKFKGRFRWKRPHDKKSRCLPLFFFLICCESLLGKTYPSSILRPVLVIFQAAILYSRGSDEQGNAYI